MLALTVTHYRETLRDDLRVCSLHWKRISVKRYECDRVWSEHQTTCSSTFKAIDSTQVQLISSFMIGERWGTCMCLSTDGMVIQINRRFSLVVIPNP